MEVRNSHAGDCLIPRPFPKISEGDRIRIAKRCRDFPEDFRERDAEEASRLLSCIFPAIPRLTREERGQSRESLCASRLLPV